MTVINVDSFSSVFAVLGRDELLRRFLKMEISLGTFGVSFVAMSENKNYYINTGSLLKEEGQTEDRINFGLFTEKAQLQLQYLISV